MFGDHERADRSWHLGCALLCFCERVSSGEIQRPERSRSELDFSAARDATVGVEITAKPAEWIGREIYQSGEVEEDDATQLSVEVSRRRAHSIVSKCLIDSDIESHRLFRLQTGIAEDRVTKETVEGRAETFKQ